MRKDFSPYRKPCCDWAVPPMVWKGGQYQHYNPEDEAIPALKNVTAVANFLDPAGDPTPPSSILPYPRPSLPVVFEATGCAYPISDGTLGHWKVGPWPYSERPSGAGGIDNNFFEAVVDTVYNRAQCRKIGFKAVQAEVWHYGRTGFLNRDHCQVQAVAPCGCDHFEPVQLAPAAVKYLQLRVEITEFVSEIDAGAMYMVTRHWIRTYRVNSQSGVITMVECVTEGITNLPSEGGPGAALSVGRVGEPLAGVLGIDACGKNAYIEDARAFDPSSPGNIFGDYWTITEAVTDTSYQASATWTGFSDRDPPLPTPHGVTIDYALSYPFTGADVYADLKLLASAWPLNDDRLYPWRTDGFVTVAPLVTRNQVAPRPGYEVTPDIWTGCLVDDVNGVHPGGDGYIETPWTDPNIIGPGGKPRDGSIRGAPNPAGYGPHFDWEHETTRVCNDGSSWHYYPALNGAWSGAANADGESLPGTGDPTDVAIPINATQWTNNFRAGEWKLPQGYVRSTPGGPCDLGKYCESKILRPSVNFFGPCGAQRFAMDETLIRCISSAAVADNIMTLTVDIVAGGSAADVDVGQTFKGRICGWDGDNGIWTITKVAADQYSFDRSQKLFDAPYDDAACTGIIGKLRFPDAWPICGRLPVSNATQDGDNVVIELDEAATWLRTGDHVDFDGVAGLEAGNNEVTVESPTLFTVPGTLGEYFGGGFVKSTGAPDYWWFDTGCKGDFLVFTATHNFRDYQETDRQIAEATACGCVAVGDPLPAVRPYQASHGLARSVKSFTVAQGCLAFAPCCPAVICFSPNGEVFPNGVTYGFPDTFTPDDRYGSLWQAWVETTMVKPDWQRPHRPCSAGLETTGPEVPWLMDEGLCRQDRQFAHWPVVEARASVPVGAPALPAGMEINYLSQADIDVAGSLPAGKIPTLPITPGINPFLGPDPLQPETPWGLWINEVACVYGSPYGSAPGQFAGEYGADGV